MISTDRTSGFTLIELLVVMAIVGVLATVVLASLNQSREKASANSFLTQLKELEKAFQLYKKIEGNSDWPAMNNASNINGDMNYIVSGSSNIFPNFNEYFRGEPMVPSGLELRYYSNGTTYSCVGASAGLSGVNIRIAAIGGDDSYLNEIYTKLNTMIDGDNPAVQCGKIRPGGGSGSVYYLIANDAGDY